MVGPNFERTSGGLHLEGPYRKVNGDAEWLPGLLEVVYGKLAKRDPFAGPDFFVDASRLVSIRCTLV